MAWPLEGSFGCLVPTLGSLGGARVGLTSGCRGGQDEEDGSLVRVYMCCGIIENVRGLSPSSCYPL